MENAYAQALSRAVESGAKPAEAVKKLHESLERNGRLGLWPRISYAFRRLAQAQEKNSLMTITIADKKHEHRLRNEAAEALIDFEIDAGGIETRVDETLIGGWRLEGREHLIDASYKQYLLEMYNRSVA